MIAVKRELRLGIGVLLASQMLVAFAAIGLLSRMAPAIDRILQENVVSIEAAEEMLAVLSRSRGQDATSRDLEGRFFGAIARARDNITESAEPAILDAIEDGYRALIRGDDRALVPAVEAVQRLVAINRQAMRRTRDSASRLSEAGAWAAVLLAILGFAAGMIVIIRVQRQVVEPLDEIYAVLRSCSEGDPFRRCQYRNAPTEVREMMTVMNELLDHRLSGEAASAEN